MPKNNNNNNFRYIATEVKLSESSKSTTEVLFRVGRFYDPRYGWFESTEKMLDEMVLNFNNQVFGQRIFIDADHNHSNGAAGEVVALWRDGNQLLADIEWTEYGVKLNRERKLCYLSPEYSENYKDNETAKNYGAVLKGGGLTIRPVIKHQQSIELSDKQNKKIRTRTYCNPDLGMKGANKNMNEELKRLLSELKKLKMGDDAVKMLSETFDKAATDDNAKALADQLIATAKKLSEAKPGEKVELNITLSEPAPADTASSASNTAEKTLSESDIISLLDAREKKRREAEAEQSRSLSDNQKIFSDALEAAQGIGEETLKTLTEASDLITADMSADQVRRLAEHQIKIGNQMEADKKLSGMGYQIPGAGSIRVGDDQSAKSLQAEIDTALKSSGAYINNGIQLSEKPAPFVQTVLDLFDAQFGRQLSEENKVLSGSTVNTGSSYIPSSFQRTVIREALSDLRILQLVQKLTDANATMHTDIPYEVRESNQVINDGIVFEGQGIPFAGVGTDHDVGYVLATKLALKVTNEVMHFTAKSLVNWNAWGENIKSNVRIIKEIIARRLANEIQRANDTFNALDISSEDVSSQCDGTKSTIVTAQFPIVRPHQEKNMKGQDVGTAENPITITIDGTEVEPWNGTGTQAAGTYYVLKNLNLGHIQFVTEAKVLTPALVDSADVKVSYSYASNIVKWDSKFDPTKTTLEKHMNGVLRLVGDVKAQLKAERFIQPEYLLMSPVLNNEITKATEFIAQNKRSGTDTNFEGDLESIKNIKTFGTDAPGIDLGHERIHMGQRNTTTYVIVKPFQTGKAFEAVNENGLATGEKMAYGEEYNSIRTPVPVRNRSKSIIVYNSDNRTAVA